MKNGATFVFTPNLENAFKLLKIMNLGQFEFELKKEKGARLSGPRPRFSAHGRSRPGLPLRPPLARPH